MAGRAERKMKVQRTVTLMKRETPTTKDVKPSVLAGGKGRNPIGPVQSASNSLGKQYTLELWGDPNMEEMLGRENMARALKRVKANKGAAGVDEMTVDDRR